MELFLANFNTAPCSFHFLCLCTHCAKTPAPYNFNHLQLIIYIYIMNHDGGSQWRS